MLTFRGRNPAVFGLAALASLAFGLACSDSASSPGVHGAGPGTVIGPTSDIQVTPTSAALNQGGRAVLRCAAFDTHGVMLSSMPNWSSSDQSVATVLSDGSVTAQGAGGALVTCTIGGKSATSAITVSNATIAFVEVSPGAGTVATGDSLHLIAVPRDSFGIQIPGTQVQWSTADTGIATVSSSGVVTAKLAGDANIRAVSGGVAGQTKIKVTPTPPPPVASVSITIDDATLAAGQMAHANAVTLDASGNVLSNRAINWSVSNSSVLSVSTSGANKANVRALSSGTAALTATSGSASASLTITVGAATVSTVSTSLASPSIVVGQSTLASATPLDGLGHPMTGTVTWSSLDPSVASVSSSGVVSGMSSGSAVIRATAISDGVTGDAAVTVTNAPVASVKTTLGSTSLNPGQTTQASVVAYDATGNVLTGRYVAWSSLNPSVATVSIAGVVTAVASGTVAIRATVESQTGDATLTVNGSTPAAQAPTASVTVTLDSSSLGAGHSGHATFVAKDANGNVLSGKTPTWSSQTPSVATVASTGAVSGVAAGSTNIQATVDGIAGSAPLTVTSVSTSPTVPPPTGSGTHPNEPTGFSQLAATTFDALDGAQISAGTNRAATSIVVDPTSPEGDTNVGQMLFAAGFPSGIAPGGFYPLNSFASKPRKVYVSFWIKLSSNWVGNAAGANKILYTQIDQNNRGSIEFVAMGGLDGTEQTIAPMMVLENVNVTPGAGSSGTPSATLVPNQVPYAASIAYQRGTWGHYEVLMTMNSAPGVADGGIKWWWNGQLYGDFTGHVDWNITASSGFNTVYWEPTYGGAGPAVPANQYMWMKDLYMSGSP